MKITDTEYEILNLIKDTDPEGTKGVSNMFIHGRLKRELKPKQIRFGLKNLVHKRIINESNFYFYLSDGIRDNIKEENHTDRNNSIKLTINRLTYAIRSYYKKFSNYPLPSELHPFFEKLFQARVNPQTFNRTMRKLGEEGRLERIQLNGNKFKYKPKGEGRWVDHPLNQFFGGNFR